MSTLDQITCRWKAADAYKAFLLAGFERNCLLNNTVKSSEIVEALAELKTLFNLLGHTATYEVVVLELLGVSSENNVISVRSARGPQLKGNFSVVNKPEPRVTLYGDVEFELIKVTS